MESELALVTFEEVVAHFGGTHESLATALGISREAVTMWNGEIPEGRAWQIVAISNGRWRFEQLPVKGRREAVA